MKSARVQICVLLLLLAGLGWGISRLFSWRLDAGDIYPPYSSLRADPLGVKAWHDSLNLVPGIEARRNYQSLTRQKPAPGATWVYLGLEQDDLVFAAKEIKSEFETLTAAGDRLVVGFLQSTASLPGTNRTTFTRLARMARFGTNKPPRGIEGAWTFHLNAWPHNATNQLTDAETATCEIQGDLPRRLPWHSTLYFDQLGPQWQVLYTCRAKPVVIERTVGPGSVVLLADSYLLSNEALRANKQPALLAWLNGPHPRTIFDEAHLGISEEPGIGALMRRYRLHGVALVLVVLIGLFVWQRTCTLVPPHAEETAHDWVAGKDAATGFTNLLHRNLRPRQLIPVCLEEWKRTVALRRKDWEPTKARLDAAVHEAPDTRHPVALYRRLCEIVAERRNLASAPNNGKNTPHA